MHFSSDRIAQLKQRHLSLASRLTEAEVQTWIRIMYTSSSPSGTDQCVGIFL